MKRSTKNNECNLEKKTNLNVSSPKSVQSTVTLVDPAVDETVFMKHVILNTSEPIILRNVLHWNILGWSKDKWEEVLKHESLEFRCGENCFTNIPQWETTTSIVHGKFSDVFKHSSEKSENWIYFDYKYLKHHLLHLEELRQNISWKDFGLDDVKVDDCTLWIGSKRAHTSLHVDTYGCNIVAQIFGRKLWVLFPPDTDLKPTRIPYEESSIFSEYNMFSPDVKSMKDIRGCRQVVLNPGEVLVVPCRWWHYVENLEPAISINAWLPLPQDNHQRLQESIIQMLISRMASTLPDEIKNHIINPNMMTDMVTETPLDLFHIIDHCKQKLRDSKANVDTLCGSSVIDLELHNRKEDIQTVLPLTQVQYVELLESQARRFSIHREVKIDHNLNIICNVMKSVTDTDIITLITNKLLQKYIFDFFSNIAHSSLSLLIQTRFF